MPMYWGDYVRDTLHLSTFQHGCYMLLIAAYWMRGKALPNDPKYLAGVCRTTPDKLSRHCTPVLAMFSCSDGWLVHKRVEKELLKVSQRSANASASAKRRLSERSTPSNKHARARVELDSNTQSLANLETQNPSCEGSGRHLPNGKMPDPTPETEIGISKAKPKATAEPRGTRLPEDWEPGRDGIEYAKELGLSAEQIRESYGAFMRHWLAKAGAAGRKVRWDLTWQTWVRADAEKLREKTERERRWAEQRRAN